MQGKVERLQAQMMHHVLGESTNQHSVYKLQVAATSIQSYTAHTQTSPLPYFSFSGNYGKEFLET